MSANELRPTQFTHNRIHYSDEFIRSVIAMFGGNRSYIDKRELRKTLEIKCIVHNRQLKMNFLAEKHSIYEAVSLFYACEWWASSYFWQY